MRVLVTRPLPDGERTAAALRTKGHDVMLAPLMQVRPIPVVLTGNWSAVIITSANAVRTLTAAQLAPLLKLPLYAVGERSAEAARQAGFGNVHSAQSDADALVRLIAGRYANESAPHLYLAGAARAADIKRVLAGKGIKVTTVEVYSTMMTGFPPELLAAIEQSKLDAVLHFSRRSAENFVIGARTAGIAAKALALAQLCLSAHVAEPLMLAGTEHVTVARRPDETSLLELLKP